MLNEGCFTGVLAWGTRTCIFLCPLAMCRASSEMEARGGWGHEDLRSCSAPFGQVTNSASLTLK